MILLRKNSKIMGKPHKILPAMKIVEDTSEDVVEIGFERSRRVSAKGKFYVPGKTSIMREGKEF